MGFEPGTSTTQSECSTSLLIKANLYDKALQTHSYTHPGCTRWKNFFLTKLEKFLITAKRKILSPQSGKKKFLPGQMKRISS